MDLLTLSFILSGICFVVWWGFIYYRSYHILKLIQPLTICEETSGGYIPFISVVMRRSKDEAALLETLNSLQLQRGVRLQVVMVCDGEHTSLDNTLLQSDHLPVDVVSFQRLPPGWVRRNYVFEVGQGKSDGEFLLFTDPGTIFAANALKNAALQMQHKKLDHLMLHPLFETENFVDTVILPMFIWVSLPWLIKPDWRRQYAQKEAGVTAFHLVRADAYRLRGTHGHIRSELSHDRALCRMMQQYAGSVTIMRAGTEVRVFARRMMGGLFRGLVKYVLGFSHRARLLMAFSIAGLFVVAILPALWMLFFFLHGTFSFHTLWILPLTFTGACVPLLGLISIRPFVRFSLLKAFFLYPMGLLAVAWVSIFAGLYPISKKQVRFISLPKKQTSVT